MVPTFDMHTHAHSFSYTRRHTTYAHTLRGSHVRTFLQVYLSAFNTLCLSLCLFVSIFHSLSRSHVYSLLLLLCQHPPPLPPSLATHKCTYSRITLNPSACGCGRGGVCIDARSVVLLRQTSSLRYVSFLCLA